ncbi:Alpha/Beta hydrolase protein [Apodospora peruviana]|uniref:Carboxylic ester hydrolase n=1 Tax=Apodospora peruviana TaxID=516989 RepID=A0AAE0I0S3_9PEZI|nr:Alpha/Beta hydrolase protein [Apodospora peruviana]
MEQIFNYTAYIASLGITPVGLAYLATLENAGPESEDCLTLNIWTKPQVGGQGKAVILFMHGGDFVTESSSRPWYNVKYIVDDQDVFLVTFNYRLTIFGFLGNHLSAPNLGLLDMRLAVEWVRDNIEGFGGDPSRITLVGQSAGGSAIDYPRSMSGTVYKLRMATNQSATDFWFNITTNVGCGVPSANRTAVYECMMTKPATNITEAASSLGIGSTYGGARFGPTPDNKLVFENYTGREPAQLPMIIGNTAYEAGLFRLLQPELHSETVVMLINQLSFDCPTAARAALSVEDGNSTWRYRFFGVFPNLMLTANPPSGAFHGSDV